jgi:asparagine synthase (glutamine-hydrolysing)
MIAETNIPAMLRFEDRNAMASSVEYRVPFLSPKLVNFLFSLPEDYVIALDGTTKAVFRRAMRGLVPDGVLDRKDKIGFGIPWGGWLAELRPWVDDVLKQAKGIPPLNAAYIARYWEEVREGRNITDRSVFLTWRWIALIKWAQSFAVKFD